MNHTKTETFHIIPDLMDLWPPEPREQKVAFSTNSYSEKFSETAIRELIEDIRQVVAVSKELKKLWLQSCEWRHDLMKERFVNSDSLTNEEFLRVARQAQSPALLVADLGWIPLEALETRSRLASFEEDWGAPGMELYDEL